MTNLENQNYPNVKQSFGIAGIVILCTIIFVPILFLLKDLIGKEASMLIYYIAAMGGALGIVYAIREHKTREKLINIHFRKLGVLPLLMLITVAVLFGLTQPIISLLPMPEFVKELFKNLATENSGIFGVLALVVAAPILEELIFRGIILEGLLKQYKPVKSILIASFLFGLVHLNPWQFVPGMLVGIFSGWVYYKTRNILPSIVIHATNNLIPVLMIFFQDSNEAQEETLVEMYGGVLNLSLIISLCLIVIAVGIYYLNKEFNKQKQEVPLG